jgi:hypothetical protein
VPPLYAPVAICPAKNELVAGLNLSRLAIQPERAKVAGQVTSVVTRSGVDAPAMK